MVPISNVEIPVGWFLGGVEKGDGMLLTQDSSGWFRGIVGASGESCRLFQPPTSLVNRGSSTCEISADGL